jgi:phosphate acetyltransferase
MTRTLLLVPTGHGVGLTGTCLGLVDALQQHGVDVGFFKPLGQPSARHTADRSTALVRPVSTLHPSEPLPPDEVERRISHGELERVMEDVVAASEPVVRRHEVVVVEGLVPGSGHVYSGRVNLALAKALDADVLLVGAPVDDDPQHLAETMAISARTYRAGEHDRVVGAVGGARHPTGRRRAVPAGADLAAAARHRRRTRRHRAQRG